MPKGMAAVAGLILAVSLALPVAAQTPSADETTGQIQRGRGKEARQAERAAAQFSEAATTYAEIINLCLTERVNAVRLAIDSARGELSRLRPMLKEETAAALEKQLITMETAEATGNLTSTALAANESFKTIITAMDPRMRRTPIEVSLHTYSAFQLIVLASAPQIDWPAVTQSAKDSEKSWIALRRMVRDTNLRVMLSEMQSGLRDAVSRNDAASVKFAARLQVASTAVLRDFFERFARSMARGR
jgi:DNA-binding TFAR19-related protein (PDSD5 family)